MSRWLIGGIAALVLAVAAPGSAQAQAYPSKPITLVAQLAAGTGLDLVTRLYAERLSQSLGQPVLVENRPGAAGMAAMETLMKAAPDGHTLAVVTSAVMAIRPTMFKKPPYDAVKDFAPVSLYLKSPFVLVVNPSLPIKSVPDLIAYLKEKKGEVSFSSSSIGGAPHLSGEYMKLKFGVAMTHVPYRNSPQAIADVAAGHIPLTFAEAGASLGLIRDGKLRALAVTSTVRLPTLPDVPPFAEAAGLPDFEAVSWHVLIAPSATPQPVLDRLNAEMNRIMALPEMKQKIAQIGLLPQTPPSIAEARRYIAAETEKWGGLVKSLGLADSL